MKASALDLRARVVNCMHGGAAAAARQRFTLGRSTVYRYLAAALEISRNAGGCASGNWAAR